MRSSRPTLGRLQPAAILSVLLVLCLRCGTPERRVVVVFPSQALMEATSAVELEVYQISGSEDVCASLRLERPAGAQATRIQSATHSFPFASETVSVGELGEGRYAFVATAKNQGGERFLKGCTSVQVEPDETGLIRVELAEFRGCCGSSAGQCSDATELACYDGPPASQGVGACQAGVATCTGGYFTTCDAQVLPRQESCDGADNDCDGEVDNVDPALLKSDPQNCGRCGRVCKSACNDGSCDVVVDGGPPDAGPADGPPEAGPSDAIHDTGPDLAPPCTTGAFECLPDGTARSCVSGSWTSLGACPLGCSATGKACRVPSNVPADLVGKGTAEVDTQSFTTLTMETDTGKISSGSTVIRPAGAGLDPTTGIYFGTVSQPSGGPQLGVFAASKFTIQQGTTVKAQGTRALVLLAESTITLGGILDVSASGRLAGSGGSDGGTPSTSGSGSGGGGSAQGSTFDKYCSGGGGGGGYGASGGAGGSSICDPPNDFVGGVGGNPYGSASLVPLAGGSGGAGGTLPTGSTISQPGDGGGGGGAVQLVAGTAVAVNASGGINAGGGGGGGCTSAGGAGGGSGGAILLEAPSVMVATGGVLAANGGGGGGADCT